MTHREKVAHFRAEMAGRGVKEAIAAPPAWRTAWGLGLEVPPSHFLGFFPRTLLSGLFFGVLWSLAIWFTIWRTQGLLFPAAAGAFAGLCFRIFLAAYYRRDAAKHQLPSSGEYPEA